MGIQAVTNMAAMVINATTGNYTGNVTNAPVVDDLLFPLADSVTIAVFAGILILLTAGGNLIVFLAFAKTKILRNFSSYLILSLAVSDFLIGAVCIPLYVPYLLTGDWPFGDVVCLTWLCFDYVIPAASTMHICVISFDRYLQVGHALWFRKHQSGRLLAVFLVVPWILPSLVFIPMILLWEVSMGIDAFPERQCWLPYSDNMTLLLIGTTVEVVTGGYSSYVHVDLQGNAQSVHFLQHRVF
jgi:histamine receptor H3